MEFIIIIFVGLIIYFAPTIVAKSRNHRNAQAIWVLNFFLGWTGLGWVIAAVWAHTDNRHPAKESELLSKVRDKLNQPSNRQADWD